MRILVINSGSSSLKFSIYEAAPFPEDADFRVLLEGEVSGIGGSHATLKMSRNGEPSTPFTQPALKADNPADTAQQVLDLVTGPGMPTFAAIGYRVVHPGPKLVGHQRITPQVFAELEQAIIFAPLHDPAVLAVIRAAMIRFPQMGHFACFDTEFHRTMPEEATLYAIPKPYRDAGARRYGFHGLSCESVIYQLQQQQDQLPPRMIIAHLGSGCSLTALRDGRSIDTSMGLTPDGGVVMGTRPGDLDPGLVLYLLRQQPGENNHAVDTVEAFLNQNSGMKALSGLENNMQVVRQAAANGNSQAAIALQVFTRSTRKAMGGFAWLLGGLDAIVFTGGIGEHDAATRSECLKDLQGLGITIDSDRNQAKDSGLRHINASDSKTVVMIVPAQEDLMIARHVSRLMQANESLS